MVTVEGLLEIDEVRANRYITYHDPCSFSKLLEVRLAENCNILGIALTFLQSVGSSADVTNVAVKHLAPRGWTGRDSVCGRRHNVEKV